MSMASVRCALAEQLGVVAGEQPAEFSPETLPMEMRHSERADRS